MTAPAGTLVDILRRHAAERPGIRAYAVLADRGGEEVAITFAELDRRARALAARIAAEAGPGERALLLFPSGIDFAVAFCACLIARVIAVPLMPPRRHAARDASAAIVSDCAPRLALSTAAWLDDARSDLRARIGGGVSWLTADGVPAAEFAGPAPEPGDIALLQYTSGSTSAPKGVVVSHANLSANLAMIAAAFGATARSTYVSWLPLYHDMGLILTLLQTLYLGATCVLMSPVAFLQRPLNWLRAIAEYRAEIAGAPNFAYDLCVARYRAEAMAGVDLSGWRLAFNGAEPVRAETLRRFAETFRPHGFRAEALSPAYGMAEATVLISNGGGATAEADGRTVVGCGSAILDERIAIVDPESRARRGPGEIGEIWVAGPNVARGYWGNPAETAATFGATIAGEGEACWLRTGDLGFIDAAGELFVTGRIKDVVIIRGVNHYPQDIEYTAERADPALAPHGGAAFAVDDPSGAEALVVVLEVARAGRRQVDAEQLAARVREAVVREHDVAPFAVTLIRPGTLPKTTSGKVRRAACRRLWLDGALDTV
jgi:acyl-CoA synthetase (AMP-forming)/AMP-acid ligase II